MNEGSQTIHYQMVSETDLTDKADKFLNKIVRLKSLGHSMNLSIKHELNSSKGELIKVIYDRLEKHSNYSKQYYEATEHSMRSEEHTSELQSRGHLVCRLLLEKKKI